MSRKMVNFDLRVYPVGGGEGKYDHQQLSDSVRTQYLEQGWDVLETEVAQIVADTIYVKIVFVKYQEIPSVVPVVDTESSEVRRGPGRPKKIREDDGVDVVELSNVG